MKKDVRVRVMGSLYKENFINIGDCYGHFVVVDEETAGVDSCSRQKCWCVQHC